MDTRPGQPDAGVVDGQRGSMSLCREGGSDRIGSLFDSACPTVATPDTGLAERLPLDRRRRCGCPRRRQGSLSDSVDDENGCAECRAAFGWRRGDDRLTVAVRYRAGDRKLDWTKPRPHRLDFYGRCFAGRRYWRGSAGAVQAPCGPPAVAGDGHEGGRAARRKDRRRRSTAPATPGAAEARLADVDGLVTTNPEWPDGPCRRAGRSVACCLRGSGDTGVTSGRSAPHSAPDSQ